MYMGIIKEVLGDEVPVNHRGNVAIVLERVIKYVEDKKHISRLIKSIDIALLNLRR